MTMIFTTFLRSLEPSGEPGDSTDFPALWRALRGALRRELRRRGLWESSPRLLGLAGSDVWGLGSGPPTLDGWFPGDALDELATETYLKVFVSRLHSLRHHLDSKPNVEGLVFRAIRQVVHDVQKRHDPLGYRIFRFTRSAIRSLLDREQIHVISGGPRIINGTVFGFDRDGEKGGEARTRIEASITRWNDDLFPQMLIVRGEERLRWVLELGERILELEAAGVRTFAFQDLVQPMKADLRERWAALLRTTGGWEYCGDNGGDPVPWVEPDNGVEERDRFLKLTHCIRRRLKKMGGQKRTRGHRQRLWDFLEIFASSSGGTGSEVSEALNLEVLPSQRELGRLLDIPRHQFGSLFQDLETAVRSCQRELARPEAAVLARPPRPTIEQGGGERLRAELLERTALQWQVSKTAEASVPCGWEAAKGPSAGRPTVSPGPRRRDWRAKTVVAVALAATLALWVARPEEAAVRGGAMPHLYLMADRVTRGLPDHRVLELAAHDTQGVLVVPLPVAPRPAHFELRRLQTSRDKPALWRSPVSDRGGGEEALILDLADFEGTFRLELIDSERAEVVSTYTFEIRRRPAAAYRRPWGWGGGSAS